MVRKIKFKHISPTDTALPVKHTLDITRFFVFICFAFSLFLYANSIFNGYNLDDELVTRKHPLTSQGIKAIPEIFLSPYYSSKSISYEYRPMVLASFAIEHQIFGESPFISHLINILLYSLSIAVLFLLLRRILLNYHPWLPFVIAMLFSAHPLHTEVVNSIKNRDEILALLFALLAAKTAFIYVDKGKPAHALLSFFCFILALLSKTSVVSMAFIIPLSLLLFSQAASVKYILITLLLSIAAGFFAPFYNVAYKVMFILVLLIAPFLLDILLHKRKKIAAFALNIKNEISGKNIEEKNVLSFSSFYLIVIIISCLVISLAGMFYNYRLMFFSAIILLIILYLISDNKSRSYLFTAIILIVSLVSANYKQAHILVFCQILLLFKYLYVEKSWRTYLIISLICLLIPWLLRVKFEGIFWFFYVGFIMWTFSIKKLRYLSIISIAIFFISSPTVSYLRHLDIFKSVYLYAFLVLSISLFIYHRTKRNSAVVFFLLFVIPLTLGIRLGSMTGSYSVVVEKYLNPATSVNIGGNILPASGRTLDKVEMPLQADSPLSLKLGTGLYVMAEYIKKLVFPLNMGFYYGFKYIEPQYLTHLQSVFSLVFHVLWLVVALWFYKREKLFLFATLTYFAGIALFTNIVAPLPGLIADRFAYVPSLGFVFCLSLALYYLFPFKTPFKKNDFKTNKGLLISFFIILSLYSIRTFTRTTDWKDHLSLFRKDIAYLDMSAQAHNLLATHLNIYSNDKKNSSKAVAYKEEAVIHYRRALEIYPDFFNASYDLARTFLQLSLKDSALVYFKKAISLKSDYFDPYLQTAFIYHQKDSIGQAVDYYNKTLQLKKDIPHIYKNLTAIYFNNNEYPNVIKINKEYMNYFPDTKEPYINTAKAYFLTENLDSAGFYFKEILRLDSTDTDALMALVEIYTKLHDTNLRDYYYQKTLKFVK